MATLTTRALLHTFCALAAAAAGCADDIESNAETDLFAAMNVGAYSDLEVIIERLEQARAAEPDDPRHSFVLGAALQWKLAESGREPGNELAIVQTYGPRFGQAMGEAFERSGDPLIGGFLGLNLLDVGFQTGDPELVAQGESLLGGAVGAVPEFGLFARALAHRGLPVDDQRFSGAIDDVFAWLELCTGAAIDRADPDLDGVLTGELIASFTGTRVFCWESERVPHAAKGAFLTGGDLLAKAGDADAARVMYENARLVPGYERWPFRDVLESRLAEDLDARGALYRDEDPGNDPPLLSPPFNCGFCHQAERD
jgi:hypothetical protein